MSEIRCYSRACSLPRGHEGPHRDGHNGARYSEPPPRCADCGEWGERTGHMTCPYPQDHP